MINGKNIYEYEYLSYMKCISAVFQDFSRLQASIAANVAQNEHVIDYEKVNTCIKKA